jgi:hypothetical protein
VVGQIIGQRIERNCVPVRAHGTQITDGITPNLERERRPVDAVLATFVDTTHRCRTCETPARVNARGGLIAEE